MKKKLRILYISSVVPNTSCGSSIAIYRHLVYKSDFEVSYCSYFTENSETEYNYTIPTSRIRKRVQNTRFSRLIWNVTYLLNWHFLPKKLYRYTKHYNPDAILTVPDNVYGGIAYQLARKLKIPLVVDFQDLFPYSQFTSIQIRPFKPIQKFLINKFRLLNHKASLAFYTSEGMRDFFNFKNNGFVLYPIGDFNRPKIEGDKYTPVIKGRFKIIYAGNCYGAYGRMLLKLTNHIIESKNSQIQLEIYPAGIDWSEKDIETAKKHHVLQDFTPFEELKKRLIEADGFLTVMSFEKLEKPFVQTSFTTKWLDYAPYGKPIFVWGPEYSSAVKFAKKYDCGIIISSDSSKEVFNQFTATSSNLETIVHYGIQARKVSDEVLNPENIHKLFVDEINKLGK